MRRSARSATVSPVSNTSQEGSMEIIRHEEPPVYTAPGLIGTVRLRAIVGDELGVFLERFDPGARNRPHTHNFDQVLYILDGEGIVATDTEEHRVYLGDLVVVPAEGQPRNRATDHAPAAPTRCCGAWGVLPGCGRARLTPARA